MGCFALVQFKRWCRRINEDNRSIKPGDIITVGDKFGWVQELKARYIVVRNREGVDTLIPNENLITSQVINWSYADPNVRIRVSVQISYDDDRSLL